MGVGGREAGGRVVVEDPEVAVADGFCDFCASGVLDAGVPEVVMCVEVSDHNSIRVGEERVDVRFVPCGAAAGGGDV